MADKKEKRTVGEMLRGAREAKELSIADVAEGTRIAAHLVEALEANEFQQVSGELYVKSFLRTLSGRVGLDPEEILAAYREQTGGASPEAPVKEKADASAPADPLPVMARTIEAPRPDELDDDADVWTIDSVVVRRTGGSARIWLVLAAAAVVIAGGVWLLTRPDDGPEAVPTPEVTVPDTTAADTMEATEGDLRVVEAEQTTETEEDQPEALVEEVPAEPPARVVDSGSRVAAPAWSEELRFDGRRPALVLRLVCSQQMDFKVESDAQRHDIVWDDVTVLTDGMPLATARPYAVTEGYALYFGADDHFVLRVPRGDGSCRVRLNDREIEIRETLLGRDQVIDRFHLR